jgi:hypothetical protein
MYFRRSEVYRGPVTDSVQPHKDSFFRAVGATLEALIAAFCRLDKSLSCCREKGWLVGAVGIEPRDPLLVRFHPSETEFGPID